MWKYRDSFRNMINVTFVTGRGGREREREDVERSVGGEETTYRNSRFTLVYMFIYHHCHSTVHIVGTSSEIKVDSLVVRMCHILMRALSCGEQMIFRVDRIC